MESPVKAKKTRKQVRSGKKVVEEVKEAVPDED